MTTWRGDMRDSPCLAKVNGGDFVTFDVYARMWAPLGPLRGARGGARGCVAERGEEGRYLREDAVLSLTLVGLVQVQLLHNPLDNALDVLHRVQHDRPAR
eukprot:8765965-Pyramimonas_sp.AAC.2